ncbi:Nitrogen assimilation regulatory protein [Polystyrenella longa]|uniref:DNA-binding transcriptional regulator NtrC n=1 Tax=Polystyrenella longa TaxID=2528007 RepID=A0A518CGF1_9PLAN|nr:sigma-54 dependent transcriptional regulator [Polystyrenella longa]QDU78308.1 Nitrogen assimilation regulatory protein [Polystyrenella longa]
MSNVLIVDDEPAICWALEQALQDAGHSVYTAASAEEALELTEQKTGETDSAIQVTPDVVMMDVRLPGIDGVAAMNRLRAQGPQTPVIIMTAFGNLDTAIRAINNGAFEYLTKPFDLDQAVEVIRRALQSTETESVEKTSAEKVSPGEFLIGKSAPMQDVFRKIALVAENDVPVLITGESGTGKELVATAVHRYSSRSEQPFVPVCVPAMSEALVESELFGHVQGAFTGAEKQRTGLLTLAHQGSAFFDEIGDIALSTQVKLLRVLENRQVTAVGSNQSQASDFRLIAATNRSLEDQVAKGDFREDLFYRLNVFRIELPPLRERREDIPLLAQHFLDQLNSPRNRWLSKRTLAELSRREWYGNVRELKNVIDHAAIVNRSEVIEPEDLPQPSQKLSNIESSQPETLTKAVQNWIDDRLQTEETEGTTGKIYESFLDKAESILLERTLKSTGGNRQEAARRLGIHRQTLREKLKRYDIK